MTLSAILVPLFTADGEVPAAGPRFVIRSGAHESGSHWRGESGFERLGLPLAVTSPVAHDGVGLGSVQGRSGGSAANRGMTSFVLPFAVGLRFTGETSFPARRLSAWAVLGR